MGNFDSKIFNEQAFGAYVQTTPNLNQSALAKSGAVGRNEQAAEALSSQTGSLYATVPYFGRISATTSQTNDGGTDIKSSNTTTYSQGYVTARRMDSWTARSFSTAITAGVDFMRNVATQVADYKFEVQQNILLSILSGIYDMSTEGDSIAATSAKDFVEKHTYDVTAVDDGNVTPTCLNKAIQQAGGDNKNKFKLVIMHSEVAANLENLKLLRYMTQTDSEGIERELALATWNGRTVLIDDNMPVTETAGSMVYTTYVLGECSIILDDIGDPHPYEMSRDAAKNGGQDTLYVRDGYVCGVDGISFKMPLSLTTTASNSDLANGENWEIINDGSTAISHKNIAIARIISKG